MSRETGEVEVEAMRDLLLLTLLEGGGVYP